MTRAEKKHSRRQRDRRYRLNLRLHGLTRRRTPRKYRIWPLHLFCGCKTDAEKSVIRRRLKRATNIAAGLRVDGRPRKPRSLKIQPTPFDRAWQTFRATDPKERVQV